MSTATARDRTSPDVRSAALAAWDAGLCVLPPAGPGDPEPKRPLSSWKRYQAERSTRHQVERWYSNGRACVGLVCGAVSAGLELFEFDCRDTYELFRATAARLGMNDLVDRIEEGYCEDTPGGGVHWLYYCAEIRGNEKLARRPEPMADNSHAVKVLIETRGEGGFVVVAPSSGLHPNGKAYRLRSGGFESIATLGDGEREQLWHLARTFDAMPESGSLRTPKIIASAGMPPGEDFNARASWTEVLAGWALAHSAGEVQYWRRPGKDHGWSATVGFKGDVLHVFSTSTALEAGRGYDKFGAYAALHHAGDFKAAARALSARGYGRSPSSSTGAVPSNGKPAAAEKPARDDGPDYDDLSDEDLGILDASTTRRRPIEWAWPYRIARGELTLLAGEGGLGKGLFMLWTAAAITRGLERPDGSGSFPAPAEPPAVRALILSAEDDPETTLAPRLDALGADCRQIRFLRAKVTIRRPDRPPHVHPVSLQDLAYWQAVFRRFPSAELFGVDGLPAYLGRGVNDSKNNEVRAVLEGFLEAIVRPARVAMMAISHLNKAVDTKSPTHRILGSVAYSNLARNVHIVVRDPQQRERRLVCQPKCNNAPDDLPSIAFKVERRVIEAEGQEIETAALVFEDKPVQVDVQELMGGKVRSKPGPPATTTLDLARWLVKFLLGRPGLAASIRETFAAAGEAGLIGELREREDGRMRWSSGSQMYRAIEKVPTLDGDEAGCRIDESKGVREKRWRLIHEDSDEAF